MRIFNIPIVVTGLVLLASCSFNTNQPTVDDMATRLVTLERERQWLERNEAQLLAELEAAKRRNVELEQQMDELNRNHLTKPKQNLTQAQRP